MNEIINRILANGFADFEGLEITGTVPVRQEFINESLAEVLQGLRQGKPEAEPTAASPAPAAPSPSSGSRPRLSTQDLAKLVKKVEVQAQDGKLVLHFEVRR
ncbi:MAG: hypothetical protein OHK0029_19020 [Armatimonadaceae bacterium]